MDVQTGKRAFRAGSLDHDEIVTLLTRLQLASLLHAHPHLDNFQDPSIMEAEVEAETRIHELQLRVEELEKLREADHAELAALRESEQAAASELDRIKTENSSLAEEAAEAKESCKNAIQAKERAEEEKRELLDALARSDSDKQQLESEWAMTRDLF